MAQVVLKNLTRVRRGTRGQGRQPDDPGQGVHVLRRARQARQDHDLPCGRLEEITAGEIAIGRRIVTDLPTKDRDIAMVFQNYALYPHMSVYDTWPSVSR